MIFSMNPFSTRVPFNFYSFKSAVIIDAISYSSMHLSKYGYMLRLDDDDRIVFVKNQEKLEKLLKGECSEYSRSVKMPGLVIEPNGEIALSIGYLNSLKNSSPIRTEFTPRKRANLIGRCLKSSVKYVIDISRPITSEWGLKAITVEDIEMTQDIIQNEKKAIAKYGSNKINAIKGKPLDPFLSSIIEMKYEEIERLKIGKNAIMKNWTLHDEHYDVWLTEINKIRRKIIDNQHQIIQILIDANDQENLIKNEATA